MRKKWTLFLAFCMLAATSVSANTVAPASTTSTQKEASKDDAKEETKADQKDDAKEETKADEKDDAKEETKADKKDDAKEETKVDQKDDAKEEEKADKKDDAKKETKVDEKELKTKAEALKNSDLVKLVNDAYKAEVKVLTTYDLSTPVTEPGYYTLKSDYATKEKVETAIAKVFSAKYTEAFLTSSKKLKVVDGKCYVSMNGLATQPALSTATVKAREVKDGQLNVTLASTVDNQIITYKAALVYEGDAWKIDTLTYTKENGTTGSVLA